MTRDKNNIGKRKNTMTNTLISKVGLEEVEQLWIQYGCYKAAEELSKMLNTYISFSTIKYLSQICNWRRNVHPNSPILIGVQRETVPASNYPHLIFPEEIRNEEQ